MTESVFCSAGYNHKTYPVCMSRLIGYHNIIGTPCDPRPVKVIVTGSRDWDDWGAMYNDLKHYPPGTVLIHGDCRNPKKPWASADRIADRLGKSLGFVVIAMGANWKKYGLAAGPMRNAEMLEQWSDADCVRAYPLPSSKGTWDMIRKARAAGIPVLEHQYR